MIDASGYLKLVDFGLAKALKRGYTYTLCGTPGYAAPEIYSGVGHGVAVDWWAVGVLMHELLTGKLLFRSGSGGGGPINVMEAQERWQVSYPEVTLPDVKPFDRGTDARDLLLGLLNPNANRRLGYRRDGDGARSVKGHRFFAGIDWDAVLARSCTPPFFPSERFSSRATYPAHAAGSRLSVTGPACSPSPRPRSHSGIADPYDTKNFQTVPQELSFNLSGNLHAADEAAKRAKYPIAALTMTDVVVGAGTAEGNTAGRLAAFSPDIFADF